MTCDGVPVVKYAFDARRPNISTVFSKTQLDSKELLEGMTEALTENGGDVSDNFLFNRWDTLVIEKN